MLLIVLTIGEARHALEAAHIVEVLPLLEIKPIPDATPAVAGICNYRGAALAVVDLNRLAGLDASPRLLSTRLVVVNHGTSQLALLAAAVTETVRLDSGQFQSTMSNIPHASWLGPMAAHGTTFVRRLEIAPLFDLVGAPA